jgi:hypothetical protein
MRPYITVQIKFSSSKVDLPVIESNSLGLHEHFIEVAGSFQPSWDSLFQIWLI